MKENIDIFSFDEFILKEEKIINTYDTVKIRYNDEHSCWAKTCKIIKTLEEARVLLENYDDNNNENGYIVPFEFEFTERKINFLKNIIFTKDVFFYYDNAEIDVFMISNCLFLKNINFNSIEAKTLSICSSAIKGYLRFEKSIINRIDLSKLILKDMIFSNIKSEIVLVTECNLNNLYLWNNSLINRGHFRRLELNIFLLSSNGEIVLKEIQLGSIKCNQLIIEEKVKIEKFYLDRVIVREDAEIKTSSIYQKNSFLGLNDKEPITLRIDSLKNLLSLKHRFIDLEEKLIFNYELKKLQTRKLFKEKLYLKWSGNIIIEVSTKYFTSWQRSLFSMVIIILFFAILYGFFPEYIKVGNSTIDSIQIANKFIVYLYFSIITFTTIGYGDMSPIGFLRLVAGFEGILGVIFLSFFVICLSRKYTN